MCYLYIFLPNHSHKILYGLYIQYIDKLYYLQTMNIQNIKYLSIGLEYVLKMDHASNLTRDAT